MKKFKKVLVCNRGEIAIRVAKTLKAMGIHSFGVASLNEKNPYHQEFFDEFAFLGSGPLSETYLNQELIIKIAKENNVDAIHPGYGMLSENAEFALNLEKAGITFIGPTADSIEKMGSKQASKEYVKDLGLSVIPGYQGQDQSLERFKKEAQEIGLPVLLKASAGGGGKGMRLVYDMSEFDAAYEASKREGLKSFGDETLLLEKYLEDPHHIEVQVMSDTHGNHIHFFDRECSIQRRHQKVVEEAPSPTIKETSRQKLYEMSTKLTSNMNYRGAGTIEYLVDKHQNAYFLEMNTRLQVEHPVTELISNADLVYYQVQVAQGESLKNLFIPEVYNGHSIELRIYAEDPEQNFLPATGVVEKLKVPYGHNIRWDGGVQQGDEVGIDFDPMIGKLVSWGPNREMAILNIKDALKRFELDGMKTNLRFLLNVLNESDFNEAKFDTHYIGTHSELTESKASELEKAALIAAFEFSKGMKSSTQTIEGEKTSENSLYSIIGGLRNV
ncbi:MAG: acetyl-CoA carboxylase biotin carboxylase subunit [Bacteriovoracaceae bacterium]